MKYKLLGVKRTGDSAVRVQAILDNQETIDILISLEEPNIKLSLEREIRGEIERKSKLKELEGMVGGK